MGTRREWVRFFVVGAVFFCVGIGLANEEAERRDAFEAELAGLRALRGKRMRKKSARR